MQRFTVKYVTVLLLFTAVAFTSAIGAPGRYGFKVRFGGRYDDVRMCVATPPGVKGGIAADVSAVAEWPAGTHTVFHADLPVMRPVLFGLAFRMLQFEPTVGVRWAGEMWEVGPVAGVSLHYGPDYTSSPSGSGRKESFFAAGPIVGAYTGVQLPVRNRRFTLHIGITPYGIPLYSAGDPQHHKGIVVGGLADCAVMFRR